MCAEPESESGKVVSASERAWDQERRPECCCSVGHYNDTIFYLSMYERMYLCCCLCTFHHVMRSDLVCVVISRQSGVMVGADIKGVLDCVVVVIEV